MHAPNPNLKKKKNSLTFSAAGLIGKKKPGSVRNRLVSVEKTGSVQNRPVQARNRPVPYGTSLKRFRGSV
jgi:hypothetical protein